MKNNGNHCPFKDILRTRDDLKRILLTGVQRTDHQLVRIGMLLYFEDFSCHDLREFCAVRFHRLDIGAGENHSVAEFIDRHIDVRIIFKPIYGN